MKTLFISDLHLDSTSPHITQTFFCFLNKIATQASALYILGDLFESYIGDDDQNHLIQSVTQALSTLSKKSISIYLMHGNRDFLISRTFAKNTGVVILTDPHIISCHNQTILLTHGDSLCTLDKNHQRFRSITRHKMIQALFLLLPLSYRKKLADKIRARSQKNYTQKSLEIMNVSEISVSEMLAKYAAHKIIHGHTHQPMITERRIVLDAWHEHGNYLQLTDAGEMQLINMPHDLTHG